MSLRCCTCFVLSTTPQNSYGTGLTDWDNCSMYGKLALFIFAAWAGAEVSKLVSTRATVAMPVSLVMRALVIGHATDEMPASRQPTQGK